MYLWPLLEGALHWQHLNQTWFPSGLGVLLQCYYSSNRPYKIAYGQKLCQIFHWMCDLNAINAWPEFNILFFYYPHPQWRFRHSRCCTLVCRLGAGRSFVPLPPLHQTAVVSDSVHSYSAATLIHIINRVLVADWGMGILESRGWFHIICHPSLPPHQPLHF